MIRKYISDSCCCFTAYNGRQRWFIEFESDSYGQSHFYTSDRAQMKAIESSEPFRSGRIRIDRDIDPEAARAAAAVQKADADTAPTPAKLVEVKGIITAVSGINFLKEKGYCGSRLNSKAAIKAKANEMGYDFVDMLG